MCTLYFDFCIYRSVPTTKNLVSIYHHTVDPLYPFQPPHPSPSFPLITTTLFSASTFLFLFHLVCSVDSTYEWNYTVFFFLRLTYFIISLISFHVVTSGKISSLLMAEWYSVCVCVCVYTYHIFFIHSVDGHWGCFHTLAILNNASMNIWMHVSFSN